MRSRRALSLLSVGLLAVSVLAFSDPVVSPDAPGDCRLVRGAETTDTADDVSVCRQDVWFHAAPARLGNAGAITDTGFPTWDTTPPDTSVTGGAGGATLATSTFHQTTQPHDPNAAFVADGVYTGAIDTLAFELYLFPPAGMAQQETTFSIDARLTVDGQPVGTIGGLTVPMETAGDAVQRIRFAWTDLADALEGWGLQLDGEHDIRVSVHGTGLATNGAVFVYDTTEVPAGMVFNIDPADLGDIPTMSAW